MIVAIIVENLSRLFDEEVPASRMRIRQERLRQMAQRSLFGTNPR